MVLTVDWRCESSSVRTTESSEARRNEKSSAAETRLSLEGLLNVYEGFLRCSHRPFDILAILISAELPSYVPRLEAIDRCDTYDELKALSDL